MMKKSASVVLIVMMCIAGILFLCGCEDKDTDCGGPVAVSLVLGHHKNFPGVTPSNTSVYDLIYEACITYGNVSIVVVDGAPYVKANYDILTIDKNITETKEKTLARQNAAAILSESINARAKTPEVDMLSAMKISADALHAADTSKKIMYIYDNGIFTAGPINQLSGDVIKTDHTIVVEGLQSLHALPDLSGIEVLWTGLGYTVGEQSEIPDSYQYELKMLWTAIIEASGGTVTFDTTPVDGEECANLPDVTPVEFVKDCLSIDYSSSAVLSEPIVFSESTVKFLGDKAEFADRQAAIEVLSPVAEMLAENSHLHVIIAGTTASTGNAEDCLQLSMRRAEACRDVLVEYGASDTQIECIGLGRAENCFRVNDLNADGTLNEKMASLNRAIYIFDADSDTAEKIRN